jgi:CRISPR system Cascade subunit CasB
MPETTVEHRAREIAKAIAAAGPGERADARRMDGGGSPLFWRLHARLGMTQHDEDRWLRLTRMLALLTPTAEPRSIHEPGRRLGAVFADGGAAYARLEKPVVSEQRFARLLAARGKARLDALERTIRMIARARPKLDVTDLAWAVLREDSGNLARDYYSRLDRQAHENEKEQSHA